MESFNINTSFGPIDPVLLSPVTSISSGQSGLWEHAATLDPATIQTLRAATHAQLIEHNRDHQGLYASYMALKGKHEQLSSAYSQLNDSLKDALNKPQQQSPLQSSSACQQGPTLPKPNQSEYPKIRFWTHYKFTQWKKDKSDKKNIVDPDTAQGSSHCRRGSAHLATTGENLQMEFIEEEDGTIVDGPRAASIRNSARRLLAQMRKDGTELPAKWQQADIYQKGYVLQALYTDYPYLSLCENHWKGNAVVSHVLSGEISKEKKKDKQKEPVMKTEPKSGLMHNATAGPSGSKRSASPTSLVDQQTPKKARLYSISPFPSPHKNQETLVFTPPADVTDAVGLLPGDPVALAPESEVQSITLCTVPQGSCDNSVDNNMFTDIGPTSSAIVVLAEGPDSVFDEQRPSTAIAADNLPLVAASEPPTVTAELPGVAPDSPFMLINPLTAVFGPEQAPSGRIDALNAKAEKKNEPKGKKKGGRRKAIKENDLPTSGAGSSNVGNALPNETETGSTSSAPSLKRVTGSKSAKNLFYIDYLTTHEPLSIEAFEGLWKTLSKEEVKKWTAAGKASRYVLEPVNDDAAGADT